jgi:hypothetical protein
MAFDALATDDALYLTLPVWSVTMSDMFGSSL